MSFHLMKINLQNYYLNIFIINSGHIILSYFLFHVEKYSCYLVLKYNVKYCKTEKKEDQTS